MTETALNWHNSEHLRHSVHLELSATGTSTHALSRQTMSGCRKRCRFGSSTSKSTATAGRSQTQAKEADTVVLPVPPLPLATDRIMPEPPTYWARPQTVLYRSCSVPRPRPRLCPPGSGRP